jgi:tetratricopeptide (TPR) repeat protein
MDNMGVLLRRQGKLEEAISWYKKSIQVLPTNPLPHMNLALVYGMLNKYEESIVEYQTLIKIDADDPEGDYGLGSDYLKKNDLPLAIEHLKKAEQLYAKKSSPVISDARYLLGVCYFRGSGNVTETRKYLKRAQELGVDIPEELKRKLTF